MMIMVEYEDLKKKFFLTDNFRESLFKKAYEKVGSLIQLGRKMGYTGPSPNWYVRRMWRGEQAITFRRLKILSEIAGMSMDEILRHSTEVHKRKRARIT